MTRKGKQRKTLAMRVLDGAGVPYEVITFPESVHDALGVAAYAGLPPEHVYKTLVVEARNPGHKPMLIMVAADRELDLKMVAQTIGAKKAHMARQVDAERVTGLKVGGISPLALLNRGFAIYIDRRATELDDIVLSAGQRGLNLRLNVDNLIRLTGAKVIEVSRE